VVATCHLNYVTMRLKGIFIIEKHEKTLNNQNPNLGDVTQYFVGPVGVSLATNFPGS